MHLMSILTRQHLFRISLVLLAFWQLDGGLPGAIRAQSTLQVSALQSSVPSQGKPPVSTAPVPQRPVGSAQLNGMIVAADTGIPVVGASVILSFDFPWEYSTTTDTGGWYRFTNLPVGLYGIRAAKTGYLVVAAARNNTELPLTPASRGVRDVAVTNGQPVRLDFRMAPAGAISGFVHDEQGEPIQGVTLSLIAPSYSDRVFRLPTILTTRTDDTGHYSLDNLEYREYYLQAKVTSLFDQRHGAGMVYPPTFFPAATDLVAAQRVSLSQRLPEARMDFSLTPVMASEITGLAVNSLGEPLAGQMLLVARPVGRSEETRVRIGPDGKFRVPAVAPDTYVLRIQANCCGPGKQEFGYAVVATAPASTTDVHIVTQPEVVVSGRIVRSTTALVGPSITVRAIPVDLPLVPVAYSVVASDGTFEFHMQPVVSRIEVFGLERGWYASLTVAGRQPIGGVIDGRGGMPIRDVLVTLSSRVAHLSGVVTQPSRGGNDRILVGVFSIDRRNETSLYVGSAYADANGHFEFTDLAPGDYAVVAVRDFAEVDMQNPAFRALVRTDGTAVSLREAESKSITMQVASITPRQ